MIPFLKKNKDGGKKPPKSMVPRTAQESIPFQRMFEDGTCRVRPGYYTRTIQYQDINYQLAQQEDKTAIFEEWCSFLNFFDSSIHFELSFVNTAIGNIRKTTFAICCLHFQLTTICSQFTAFVFQSNFQNAPIFSSTSTILLLG